MKIPLFLFQFLCVFSFLAQPVNQTDSKGRKQGTWQKTYPDSRVFQYKGQFKDDKPVGTFSYFYPSAKVKAVVKHTEGSPRSVAFFYHENGKLMSAGIYMNGEKDSVWNNYAPSGRLSFKESFKNGQLSGQKTVYYLSEDPSDNSERVSAVMNYSNGKLNGSYKEYYDFGGVRKEGIYVDDKKDGIWKTYFPNGKMMFLERFKKGIQHGWSFGYDEQGNEVGRKYFYYGKNLTGKELEFKMKQLKELGVDPNG